MLYKVQNLDMGDSGSRTDIGIGITDSDSDSDTILEKVEPIPIPFRCEKKMTLPIPIHHRKSKHIIVTENTDRLFHYCCSVPFIVITMTNWRSSVTATLGI
jgi:hypothetical protein